jgi:hypothetical protein
MPWNKQKLTSLPMRVLLDECVPRGLRAELPGHEVKTVAEAGWAGAKNGLRWSTKTSERAVISNAKRVSCDETRNRTDQRCLTIAEYKTRCTSARIATVSTVERRLSIANKALVARELALCASYLAVPRAAV